MVQRESQYGKVILPIWHKVTYKEVLDFSPTLADKLAANTSKGLENVINKIVQALKQAGVVLGETETVNALTSEKSIDYNSTIQPPTATDNLTSIKGIDYTRLRDLLAAKHWEEADEETYLVMIRAVGKEDGDLFTPDELLNFPCTDLRTIDRLWVKYSSGNFGFSVQKEIYLSVGGKADGQYYREAWEKFGDRVGWRVQQEWIFDSNVTTSSSRGHLPLNGWLRISRQGQEGLKGLWNDLKDKGQIGGIVLLGGERRLRECWSLFSRIKTCKL
ncbi:MAG: GUN4 domain-containing protein [Nostoc sp. LPT]|nr:GUN4 domain-containing protein [Nostoc sp. LPT]